MIFAPAIAGVPAEADLAAESAPRQPRPEWVAAERPDERTTVIGELETRYLHIEGGNLLLRLDGPAVLRLNCTTMRWEVEGWGVSRPMSEAHQLPREMARRFLDLFSKAEDGRLNGAEADAWLAILDRVDYAGFSIDRAAPQYLEGTLLRQRPHCRVEWHDGTAQTIPHGAAASLAALDPGERFGAFVKLGRNNAVTAITQVSKLPGD